MNLEKKMAGQLFDVIVMIDRHIIICNSYNFVIQLSLVNHSHNTDDFCIHKCQYLYFDTTQNKNIQRVMVSPIGHWDKSVVGWIVYGTKKHSVKFNQSTFLIKLIFGLAAGWDLNQGPNNSGGLISWRNKMPWILCNQISSIDFVITHMKICQQNFKFYQFQYKYFLIKNCHYPFIIYLFLQASKKMKQENIKHQNKKNSQEVVFEEKVKKQFTIYDGLMGKSVNLSSINSSKIFKPQQICIQADNDARLNALKYRFGLKYLGKQYEEIVVPCTPAYQLSLYTCQQEQKIKQVCCFAKTPNAGTATGIASGKRSAIYRNEDGHLIRFKGCGNQYKGFNKQNNQSRGHHFYHTAKRQLFMTKHINQVLRNGLGIDPPANKPLYAFEYSPKQIQRVNLTNELPLISKYCCVFETQGDRRAGTHLISPLEILYLNLIDHEQANWKPVFQSKDRIDNGELVQLVTNFQLFLDGNSKFLDIYDHSSQISNYLSLGDAKLKLKQSFKQDTQSLFRKLIPQTESQIALQIFSKMQKQKFINCIQLILKRIGFQMGQVKRVMCQNEITWGFYLDHGVEWHCNAHLNNFIINRPDLSSKNKNYFLLPLDYDLAYTYKEFVCIDLQSPSYGQSSQQIFQNYLCAQYSAMQMSLFGLQLMNFKYGIDESKNNENTKMGRIAFRDTLVSAFNAGMRNRKQIYQQVKHNWDQEIQNIQVLVEACLYLSIDFQT